MLNIYYGREDKDKSKFIYEHMEGKTLLIVPDQFTLQGERDAFFYLNKEAVTNVDVVTFSRLGYKIIEKTGGRRQLIGKEGRQMLLTEIVAENKKNLEIFGGSAGKQDFISLLNDLISDMKQSEATPETLREAIENLKGDSLLKRKLKEVLFIFEKYENAIEGKYIDSEDYISFFTAKMKDADFIRESSAWIYAFDSFTEKNLSVIRALEKNAKSVNLVLTYADSKKDGDLFTLTGNLIKRLKKEYPDAKVCEIGADYNVKVSDDIAHLEKEIYAIPSEKKDSCSDISLVTAANPYSQAASAAAYVRYLTRDLGYRYGEIAIISNDLEEKGHLYKRVFSEYGMELFIDKKRDILHQPVITYMMSLLDIKEKGYRSEDVIKYIKTGFVCSDCDAEELELYAEKYGIRGSRWKQDFYLGEKYYGKESLERLNALRKTIVEKTEGFFEEFSKAKSMKEKADCLEKHMEKDCNIRERLENTAKAQEEKGNLEIAEEISQIWEKITDIFAQMKEISSERSMSVKEFKDILKTGLSSVKMGLIPPASDILVIGSMQRTRRGKVKATVVLDAAEGLLPKAHDDAGILSEDEKDVLAQNNIKICSLGSLMSMEEAMAIYRNLSKTEEKLYISYAVSGSDGKGAEASDIFAKITEIFNIEIEKDIFERDQISNMIGGFGAAENNMIDAIRSFAEGEKSESIKDWQKVFSWFSKREDVNKIVDSITEIFGIKDMEPEKAAKLYKKDENANFKISPSRLEKFGKCPFAHFVSYGLRPEEEREYTVGAAEAGSIYHECLMRISQELSKDLKKQGIDITDERSPWLTVTRQEISTMVGETLNDIASEYDEGLLTRGEEEKYRTQRIREVCEDSVWMAVQQVRCGAIEEMAFEEEFGENKNIPPIEVTTENGTVLIEGKIDRCDVLKGGYGKIVDYKSGADTYVEEEARKGIKLQLFIYLMAAAGRNLKPGGAFYFHVTDARVKNPQNVDKEVAKKFKMDGFALDDGKVINAIDETGNILTGGKGKKLSQPEFDGLLEAVKEKVEEMAGGISGGEIGIKPKKVKNKISCEYCPYKGICKFDLSVEGCRYNMI